MQAQSQRESDHIVKEAEVEARRLLAEADEEVRNRLRGVERRLEQGHDSLEDLERRRDRFLKEFRGLLERELDVVQVEVGRTPLDDRAIDLALGAGRGSAPPVDRSAHEMGATAGFAVHGLDADVDEVRHSLAYMAKTADRYEHAIFRTDEN